MQEEEGGGYKNEILKSSNLREEGNEEGRMEIEGQNYSPHPNLTLCFGSLDKSLPCSAHWSHFNSAFSDFLRTRGSEIANKETTNSYKTGKGRKGTRADALTRGIQRRLLANICKGAA